MSIPVPWHLLTFGCGTAGLACVRALAVSPMAASLASATLIDKSLIRDRNSITCAEYAGHEARPKNERLRELTEAWTGGRVPVLSVQGSVEAFDWQSAVRRTRGLGRDGQPKVSEGIADDFLGYFAGETIIALIGLDDWDSRLTVVRDLRRAASAAPPSFLAIQVGLERDEAQVSVFGPRWDDPCPACGLFLLPTKEPCVLWRADGTLVRGDLQREAHAAAALVCDVVADHLLEQSADGRKQSPGKTQGEPTDSSAACPNCRLPAASCRLPLPTGPAPSRWTNAKTNLLAISPGSAEFRRVTRVRTRMAGCLGAHEAPCPHRWEPTCTLEEFIYASS